MPMAAPTHWVVCILKTNNKTHQKAHVLLFSNDLTLETEKMIDYYALRFQIEFNFRDAKQYWGLADFMNIKQAPVNTAVNLALFLVNVSAKLRDPFELAHTDFSVLDIKAWYRGLKFLAKTLKRLPQKLHPIVIQDITEHIATIGAIHQIPNQIDTG